MLSFLQQLLGSKPLDEYQDITQHEIQALKYKYNLADAHTHQSQSPSQREIIAKLPTLWHESEKTLQHEMEEKFITAYIEDSEKDNFVSVVNLLDENRAAAKQELASSVLEMQEPTCKVSVAWFKITDPKVTANDIQQLVLKHGVYILPGTYFYWSDKSQGYRYVRIALARDQEVFLPAIKLVREALSIYGQP